MTEEMKTAINRLQELPENTQEKLAPHLNEYLNKLEDLQSAIQEGLQSGEPVTLSKDDLLKHLRKRQKDLA